MLSNSYLFISIVGILVLIAFHTFLYLTHKEKITKTKKKYEQKEIENITFEKTVQESQEKFFLNSAIHLKDPHIKKFAILVAYDYDIEFASWKNSEKLEDYARFLQEKLEVKKIFKFKNEYDESVKKKILDTLHLICNEENYLKKDLKKDDAKEHLLFIHFFSLCTCVNLKKFNEIESAVCIGNDLLYENELKKEFLKFKNFKIFCGFEPSSNVNCFLPLTFENRIDSSLKSGTMLEDSTLGLCNQIPLENYESRTEEGYNMVPIPFEFKQILKPNTIKFVEKSNLIEKPNYKFNYNTEKNFSLDSYLHSMTHKNLAYLIKAAFSMYFSNSMDLIILNNFLHYQNVKQSSSFLRGK